MLSFLIFVSLGCGLSLCRSASSYFLRDFSRSGFGSSFAAPLLWFVRVRTALAAADACLAPGFSYRLFHFPFLPSHPPVCAVSGVAQGRASLFSVLPYLVRPSLRSSLQFALAIRRGYGFGFIFPHSFSVLSPHCGLLCCRSAAFSASSVIFSFSFPLSWVLRTSLVPSFLSLLVVSLCWYPCFEVLSPGVFAVAVVLFPVFSSLVHLLDCVLLPFSFSELRFFFVLLLFPCGLVGLGLPSAPSPA